jgi:hypothetical protein
MSLLIKLQSLQSELSTFVEKEGENTFSKYTYVMLGTILSKIKPSLDKYKLILTASVTTAECHIEFQSNGFYSIGNCKVETILIDSETDERISNCSYGFATDKNGDKALFKAITGARKYGISTLLGLQWDSDDEPEKDTPDLTDSPSKAKVQRPPAKVQTKTESFGGLF